MENAAKALLIAGGILILILVITLLVTFWDQMSTYFTAQHEKTILQQTVEFNNKFENYNQQTIRGNELISIFNKIIDYNNMQADMLDYKWMMVSVDLQNHQSDFLYPNTPSSYILINNSKIENAENDDSALRKISGLSAELTSSANIPKITDTKLQKLSAEIDNIIKTRVSDFSDNGRFTAEEQFRVYKESRAQKLTKILGYNVDGDGKIVSNNTNILNDVIEATYKYYQLTQFKRALFKCTDISYDVDTGRVNGMKFEVVIENGNIKMK